MPRPYSVYARAASPAMTGRGKEKNVWKKKIDIK